MFGRGVVRYQQVDEVEDNLSDFATPVKGGEVAKCSHDDCPRTSRPMKFRSSVCWLWLNLSLFSLSVVVFLLSLRNTLQTYPDNVDQFRNHRLKEFSMPSPLLDEVDFKIAPKRMDATLLKSNPLSIYRQEPSMDVDVAWERLWDSRPVPISKQKIVELGRDPAEAVQVPEDWGYGSDTYFGRLDVLHQIHCLDALRREVHFDHYYGKKYPGGFDSTTEFHQLHLSHCVYLLLQNVMCNAKTDIYTHIWTDTLTHPFPDFNVEHKCTNFDAIMDWQDKHAMDEKAFVNLTRPEGYPYRKMTHKFKEIHGWFDNHEDDGDYDSGEIA